MKEELIKIFDKARNPIGIASRDDVHKNGYWHETFQCWFIQKDNNKDYIYFQIRSDEKKDYPSLLDITAAGHILADETIEDGVREIEEELGVAVSIEDMHSVGIIEACIISDHIIDREYAHVFVYELKEGEPVFELQKEEVAGIVRAEFKDFYQFCLGEIEEIKVNGFTIDASGKETAVEKRVTKQDFVPHPETYWMEIVKGIDGMFRK